MIREIIRPLLLVAGCVSWAAGLVCTSARADTPAFSPDQVKFFEEEVRPVLANRCHECHGPKKQESGLRLDSRAAVLQGGDGGSPAATPGKPERATTKCRQQPNYRMPKLRPW
jgi:hypothetical protein